MRVIKIEGSSFKRIMIFGRPGSGKSTFATWLSRALNLPLHHLDKHFYKKIGLNEITASLFKFSKI
jgi:adenylate kinase family enzyme